MLAAIQTANASADDVLPYIIDFVQDNSVLKSVDTNADEVSLVQNSKVRSLTPGPGIKTSVTMNNESVRIQFDPLPLEIHDIDTSTLSLQDSMLVRFNNITNVNIMKFELNDKPLGSYLEVYNGADLRDPDVSTQEIEVVADPNSTAQLRFKGRSASQSQPPKCFIPHESVVALRVIGKTSNETIWLVLGGRPSSGG